MERNSMFMYYTLACNVFPIVSTVCYVVVSYTEFYNAIVWLWTSGLKYTRTEPETNWGYMVG